MALIANTTVGSELPAATKYSSPSVASPRELHVTQKNTPIQSSQSLTRNNKVKRKRQPAIALLKDSQLLHARRRGMDDSAVDVITDEINDPLISEAAFRKFLSKATIARTVSESAITTTSSDPSFLSGLPPPPPPMTQPRLKTNASSPPASLACVFDRNSRIARELCELERKVTTFVRALRQLRDYYHRPLIQICKDQTSLLSITGHRVTKNYTYDGWPMPVIHHYVARSCISNHQIEHIIASLFAKLPSLIRLHAGLLTEIRLLCESEELLAHQITSIFNARLPLLDVHVAFVEQQTEALVAFEQLYFYNPTIQKILETLSTEANSVAQVPSLSALLAQPRHQLQVYVHFLEMLLEECIDKQDSKATLENITDCLLAVECVYKRTTKWVGRLQHIDRIIQIQRSIEQLPEPLLTHDQLLMHEGKLRLLLDQQVSGRSVAVPVHGWLFANKLVLARPVRHDHTTKAATINRYVHKASLCLTRAIVRALSPSKQPSITCSKQASSAYASPSFIAASAEAYGAFQIDLGDQATILLANSTREYNAWCTAFSDAMELSSNPDNAQKRFLVL